MSGSAPERSGSYREPHSALNWPLLTCGLFGPAAGVAICVVTILQEEVDDAYRGRAFAFYDMTFNVTYAVGAVIFAAFMPSDGRSPIIIGVLAAGYAVAAAAYWLLSSPGAASPAGPGASSAGSGTGIPSEAAQPSSS